MKISLDWLSDFVAFSEKDPQKIAEVITLGAAEIDEVEVQGALLDLCCIGKVLTVEKHPNADKLSLCDVETDKGKKRVVCGGVNLREGMLVAFAHIGAKVKWHGEEMMGLKPVKIRGEQSEGMICAAEELDLTNQFPETGGKTIIDMGDDNYQVGQPLKEALQLNDVIFHVDNHSITHRADLFSHVSFARECVALGLGTWKKKPEYVLPEFPNDPIPFTCKNDIKALVPRYLACIIAIDAIGETPDWMKKRLIATGWRPVNLPVDITNYVSMEVGMPLHSFDADDLKGDVHFRTTKKGEKIVTLDAEERELPEGAIVLSDDEGIFDLMGVMGGLRSSTKETTKNMYLHSAVIDPVSVRKVIIATGHRTEASTVYEKGIPLVTAERGFARALELILELIPGAKLISSPESYGDSGQANPIQLSLTKISSILGREVSGEEATKALKALDFDVQITSDSLQVTPPLDRLGDVSIPEDVIEEIARIIGFTSFEEELPCANITPPLRDQRIHTLRDTLKEAGFIESVQFSFIGEELLKKAGLESPSWASLQEIENPLGEDIKFMRSSLLPRLLDFAEENIRLADNSLKVFEVGHVFSKKDEIKMMTLLIADKRDSGIKGEPFLLAKSVVTEMVCSLDARASFAKKKKKHESYEHPGRSMSITISKKDVGSIFEIHPSICSAFNLPNRAAAVIINIDALLEQKSDECVYSEIFDFPSIEYDTTIILTSDVSVGPLLEKARGCHEFLRDVRLVDLYQKGSERSVTVRCTYNAGDRTLKEEEVKPIQEKVEVALQG